MLAGEAAGLLKSYDTLLLRQLALIHRDPTPDYFAGLDSEAAYPSYRCSAANRGRIAGLGKSSDRRQWNTKIGGLIWPSAIIDRNGDLYTGHADGEFVALHPDGSEAGNSSAVGG